MKKSNLNLASLVALASVCSIAAAPDVTTKNFDVKPGGTLYIEADRGNITVKSADIQQAQVRVERELKDLSDAKQTELLQEHNLTLSQDGSDIRIKATRNKKSWGWKDPFNKMKVHYTVTVPSKFNADVQTAGGNVQISSLQGTVKAHTSGGNMAFETISGPVSANTSGGNISLKESTGNAELNTSGGNIQVGTVDGNLVAKTSGGDIRVANVVGAVEARTSGGNIQVNEVGGPLQARTSGGNVSASLSKQPKGDSVLRTSGGNVELTIPEGMALTVDAETSGGSVSSDFPAEINKSRTKLHASLNGGGPAVDLGTSGGSIRVKKN